MRSSLTKTNPNIDHPIIAECPENIKKNIMIVEECEMNEVKAAPMNAFDTKQKEAKVKWDYLLEFSKWASQSFFDSFLTLSFVLLV